MTIVSIFRGGYSYLLGTIIKLLVTQEYSLVTRIFRLNKKLIYSYKKTNMNMLIILSCIERP